MKASFKKASDNDLSELSEMFSRINKVTHDFNHVTDFLPEGFFNYLDKVGVAVQDEREDRENKFD